MSMEGQELAKDGLELDDERKPIELSPAEIARARGSEELPDDEPQVEEFDEAEEEIPPSTPEPKWYEDEFVKTVARSHRMSDKDLESFNSRDAFTGFLKYLETLEDDGEPEAPPVDPAPKKSEPAAAEDTDDDQPVGKDGLVNVEYYRKNDYDDATIAAYAAVRTLQEQLKAQQEKQAEVEKITAHQRWTQYQEACHDCFDAMNPEFYGATKGEKGFQEISPEQSQRRTNVFGKAELLRKIYSEEKQPVPPLSKLLAEAEAIVYAKELATAQKSDSEKEYLERVAKQSRKRRPAASSAGLKGGLRVPDEDPYSTEAISRKVAAKFRELEEANGTR